MRKFALWLIPLSLLLASCGWHLRGLTPLPAEFRILHLQSAATESFNQRMILQLEFNQVLLTDEAEDAQAVLKIPAIEIEKRTLSLTSNGQIAEFELNALLTASVKRNGSDNEHLIEVKARRHLRNDVNNATSTASAEKALRLDLERDLANKLLLRLQHLSSPIETHEPTDHEAE